MFDAGLPWYLRAFSLFHVFLPLLLLCLVGRLGYEQQAWLGQTILAWIVLPLTYRFVDPKLNVNWVRSHSSEDRRRMSPLVRLILLIIGYPVFVYFPTHLLLRALFR